MEFKKTLVSLVALFAVAFMLFAGASALSISSPSIEVNSISSGDIGAFAGETLPVRVTFTAEENASDVRIKAWLIGGKDYTYSSDRFDVIDGSTYSKLIAVEIPSNMDDLNEDLQLKVVVESENNGDANVGLIDLVAQRNSYTVDFLDAIMDSSVAAGSNVPIDIVLKNRGSHEATDTFVKATIAALGIERRVYLGDLSSVDQADPDKEDAVERRMYLSIPSNAPAGLYTIQFEAYNSDSDQTITKKIVITGSASGNSQIVSSANQKKFAVGDSASYSFTLVNTGDQIKVYNIQVESPSDLSVQADDSIVVVPAGSSKTVTLKATAAKAGDYSFIVNVVSEGNLVKKESFVANVDGKSIGGANATLILTIVLAIVFIVLLVVLIVLLTRKPQKTEEFGESYY